MLPVAEHTKDFYQKTFYLYIQALLVFLLIYSLINLTVSYIACSKLMTDLFSKVVFDWLIPEILSNKATANHVIDSPLYGKL